MSRSERTELTTLCMIYDGGRFIQFSQNTGG